MKLVVAMASISLLLAGSTTAHAGWRYRYWAGYAPPVYVYPPVVVAPAPVVAQPVYNYSVPVYPPVPVYAPPVGPIYGPAPVYGYGVIGPRGRAGIVIW
jgi:hypothetical protein